MHIRKLEITIISNILRQIINGDYQEDLDSLGFSYLRIALIIILFPFALLHVTKVNSFSPSVFWEREEVSSPADSNLS